MTNAGLTTVLSFLWVGRNSIVNTHKISFKKHERAGFVFNGNRNNFVDDVDRFNCWATHSDTTLEKR